MANRIPRLLAGTRRTSWISREGSNRALPGLFGQGTALRISYTRDVDPFLTRMIQRHRCLGFHCPNHARRGCSSNFRIQTNRCSWGLLSASGLLFGRLTSCIFATFRPSSPYDSVWRRYSKNGEDTYRPVRVFQTTCIVDNPRGHGCGRRYKGASREADAV